MIQNFSDNLEKQEKDCYTSKLVINHRANQADKEKRHDLMENIAEENETDERIVTTNLRKCFEERQEKLNTRHFNNSVDTNRIIENESFFKNQGIDKNEYNTGMFDVKINVLENYGDRSRRKGKKSSISSTSSNSSSFPSSSSSSSSRRSSDSDSSKDMITVKINNLQDSENERKSLRHKSQSESKTKLLGEKFYNQHHTIVNQDMEDHDYENVIKNRKKSRRKEMKAVKFNLEHF